MSPIVCVVGASGSGKTTFLEQLIPALTRRGYRVGTVKHDVHGFEMDREGKDTWRHREAGAQTVGILSPSRVASIRNTEEEMELARFVGRTFWAEDLVITEGFKRSSFPKIEIFRAAVEPEPICTDKDHLVALVTDDPIEASVPIFHFQEVERLADWIEDRYLKNRKKRSIMIHLDGKRLPMKDFVEDIVSEAIKGMLSTLRGWGSPKSIEIQMTLEDE